MTEDFQGNVFDPAFDSVRLQTQADRLRALMHDGKWRTLAEISATTNDPEASISRMLRYFREPRHGGYQLDKRPRGERVVGLWEYRLRNPGSASQAAAQTVQATQGQRITKQRAAVWLTDLMALTNAAGKVGITVPSGVYELETYLNERKQ